MTTRSKLTLVVTLGMTVFGMLTFLIGLLLGLSSPPPMAAYPPALAAIPGAGEDEAVIAPQPIATSPVPATATGTVATVTAQAGPSAGASDAVAYAPLPPAAPGSIPAAPVHDPAAPGAPIPLTGRAPQPGPAPAHGAPRPETKPPAPRAQVAASPEGAPEGVADGAMVEVTGRSVPEPMHAVQVGRFLSRSSAETLMGELIARGYDARVVAAQSLGVPTTAEWYLVTIGPQPDRPTADQVAREVSAAMGLPAQSVSWAVDVR